MPSEFPLTEYDAVSVLVSMRLPTSHPALPGFVAAWNGLAYRFKAAAEANARFTSSIAAFPHPQPEDRYEQEHAFFDFLSSGLSCLECCDFGLYHVAAAVDPVSFPLSPTDVRRVSPSSFQQKLSQVFGGEPLGQEIASLLADPTFDELSQFRNVNSHRGALPRQVTVGLPESSVQSAAVSASPATNWTATPGNALRLDPSTTASRLDWLARRLTSLLDAGAQFASRLP
jgi:hypothetical protein